MNNYEKIKQMTIEEMAEHFLNIRNTCITCVAFLETCNGDSENDCIDNIKQWLLQEVEEWNLEQLKN